MGLSERFLGRDTLASVGQDGESAEGVTHYRETASDTEHTAIKALEDRLDHLGIARDVTLRIARSLHGDTNAGEYNGTLKQISIA